MKTIIIRICCSMLLFLVLNFLPLDAATKKPDADDALGYYNGGISYYMTGEYEKAAYSFQKAIDIFNRSTREKGKDDVRETFSLTEAHFNLGVSYLYMDNITAALKQYKIIRKQDKTVAERLHDRIEQRKAELKELQETQQKDASQDNIIAGKSAVEKQADITIEVTPRDAAERTIQRERNQSSLPGVVKQREVSDQAPEKEEIYAGRQISELIARTADGDDWKKETLKPTRSGYSGNKTGIQYLPAGPNWVLDPVTGRYRKVH